MDETKDYFQALADKLSLYLNESLIEEIRRAYQVAQSAHAGQKRRTGEDYITHPVAAASILADLNLEHETIIATLLHDVIEDSDWTKEQLAASFGTEVAELVDGVSKLKQITFSSRAEAQAENFRKMLMAMVRDTRVMIVKLVDRLHNMRTLGIMPNEKKRRIARETLEIYAPIAHRLGIHPFFTELEDLGFKSLYPLRYRVIEHFVREVKERQQKCVDHIIDAFSKALKLRGVANFKLYNRQRHLLSIYRKIKNKKRSLSEVMQRYSFRIIVDGLDDCYRALGAAHQIFKPRPNRFRDYISIPKANGYQALHTMLFGPDGVPIDVQIRTKIMEDIAEHGIAAHWIHSKNYEHNPTQSRTKRWMQYLEELQKNSSNSVEFIETVKSDLFPKEVYVFTPDGDILELAQGATAVDFAYAVHSHLGNQCVAIKIDRKLSPLSSKLQSGQTLEVITANGASPNLAWLNFVITGKARTNIRHFLKTQKEAQSHALGHRMLAHVLESLDTAIVKFSEQDLESASKKLKQPSFEALCTQIASGNILPLVVVDVLLPEIAKQRRTESNFETAHPISPLIIRGTEGMMTKFATCCHPIPGDPIVGSLQSNRGICVHIEACPEVKKFQNNPARYLVLCWAKQIEEEFKVGIDVYVTNRRGVLGMIATAVSDEAADIMTVSIESGKDCHAIIRMLIQVKDCRQLEMIRHRLQLLPVVNQVMRV